MCVCVYTGGWVLMGAVRHKRENPQDVCAPICKSSVSVVESSQ